MNEIKQISIEDAGTELEQNQAVFLDIRDPNSYEGGHIDGAIHLNDSNAEAFVQSADKSRKTIVYCYHGISSQGAAAYLQEQGFVDVHSMIGGYEAWKAR